LAKEREVKYDRELQTVVDGAVRRIALTPMPAISREPTQTVQEISPTV
jgi:hypothetical protein